MNSDMTCMSQLVTNTGIARAATANAYVATAWIGHDAAVKPSTKPVVIGFLRSTQRPSEVSP